MSRKQSKNTVLSLKFNLLVKNRLLSRKRLIEGAHGNKAYRIGTCILASNSQKHKLQNVVQTGITQEISHIPEKAAKNPVLSAGSSISKRPLKVFKHAPNNRVNSIVRLGTLS